MPPDAAPMVLVISHTHWDREWYHTAERFRQRLVALVDDLLDDRPAPDRSFLLDGQAVLLDDYLAVRGERAGELAALLREGRLEAGPWYVLADNLIPSAEALVRNLLHGRAAVQRLRGTPPPVLYCPDSFGHPAALPDLAAGFGCHLVVLWRGYGGARWPAGDTVRWRGSGGADVLVSHLPPDGYETGASLPTDAGGARVRWATLAAALLPRATLGLALLPNGADHHARQHGLDAALAALAAAARPVTVRSASLADAAAALRARAAGASLPEIAGELRDSYGYTWTLAGTLGSRAAQKRANAMAERLLVRDVEPWLALSGAGAASRALLDASWRELLLAHPHDTLCGTSIDAVAAAFDARVARAAAQGEGLRADALDALVAHDAGRARATPRTSWRPALVLRNPAPRPRGGVAEVIVSTTLADIAVGPGSATRQGVVVPADDSTLRAMGAQLLDSTRAVERTEAPRAYPDADLVEHAHALIWTAPLAGYSVALRPLDDLRLAETPDPVCMVGADGMEQRALRVSVGAGGEVRLEERATGRVIPDLLTLELRRDAGDLYTPAIREAVGAIRCEGVEVRHRGPLRGELAVRFVDGDDGSAITLRLQLDAGSPALGVFVEGTNARRDARLRLVVATGAGMGATTLADAAFHPVIRVPLSIPERDAAMEHVVPTAPLHRWVSRYGATAGATLASDGLAEYESLEDGGIAVTLLRAVGELSRADLPERPGHAGWPAPTPGAQAQGAYAARFAVMPHGSDTPLQRDEVERLADDVLHPLQGTTLRANASSARVAGGLELSGAGLAFSAAFPARRAGWTVLRCVNRLDQATQGGWRVTGEIVDAVRARLDETPTVALAPHGGTVAFTAQAREIVTVLVRLAPG